VKELKVPHRFHKQPNLPYGMWNPVKELKVKSVEENVTNMIDYVESGEGIERRITIDSAASGVS